MPDAGSGGHVEDPMAWLDPAQGEQSLVHQRGALGELRRQGAPLPADGTPQRPLVVLELRWIEPRPGHRNCPFSLVEAEATSQRPFRQVLV